MNDEVLNCEWRRRIALLPRFRTVPGVEGERTHSIDECCTHPNGPTTKFAGIDDPLICDVAVRCGECPLGLVENRKEE